jgi:hypothetical protein
MKLSSSSPREHESEIGSLRAYIIDREAIKDDFYMSMDEPSQEFANIAVNLFDESGKFRHTLRNEVFKNVKEMNSGGLLIVDEIKVNSTLDKSVASDYSIELVKALVKCIQDEAWHDLRGYNGRVSTVGVMVVTPYEVHRDEKDEATRMATRKQRNEELVYIYRQAGFRRIGRTLYLGCVPNNKEHPCFDTTSEDMSEDEDFNYDYDDLKDIPVSFYICVYNL